MSDAGDETKFTLKVVINKQKNKVLFAEAGSDFTDVLLSVLTLPLGRIVKVLEEHNGDNSTLVIGSLTTMYKGLSDLNNDYFWTEYDKFLLLNPISSLVAEHVKLKLSVDYPQPPKDLISEDMSCKRKSKRSRHASVASKTPVAYDADDDVKNGGFTKKSASFVISDDLQIFPVLPGSILQTLINFGITETDGPELRTLILGLGEIVDLLKFSLLSKTPLTDLVFREKSRMDHVTQRLRQLASNEGSKKMMVKAMIQKSTNRILFVEAEDDFVDFLCSFLTVPLGAVECLLGGNTCLKNIDNLYSSVTKNIDGDKYFKSKETKAMLLKPQLSECYNHHNHFLPLAVKGLSTSQSLNTNGARKYVKKQTMYNVTDDLVVTPFSLASSFSLLSQLKISLSDVDEVELKIGLNEALRILMASLTSTTALTDGLMNSISKKQPKQEQ